MPRTKRFRSTLMTALASSAVLLAGVSYSPAHASPTCPAGFATIDTVGSVPVCQLWRFGGSDISWTVPAGVASVDVLIVGGGGAGSSGALGGGGGGGGGAVRWEIGLAVSAGDRLDLEPGVGGTPGVTGGDGEASLFRHVLSGGSTSRAAIGGKGAPAPTGPNGEIGALGGAGGDPNSGNPQYVAGSDGGAGGNFDAMGAGTAGVTAQAGQQIDAGLFFPFPSTFRWQVGGGGGGGGTAVQTGGASNSGGGGAGGRVPGGNGETQSVSAPNPSRAGGGGGGGAGNSSGAPGSGGAGQGGVVAIRILGITVTNYTVTYDASGGTVTPASATFTVGGSPLVLPTPTRSGFTFNGWFTQAVGGTRVGGGGDSYSPVANGTLHAQWTSTPPDPGPPGPTPSSGSDSNPNPSEPNSASEIIDEALFESIDRRVPLGQAVVVNGSGNGVTVPATVVDRDEVRVGTEAWSIRISTALNQPDRQIPGGLPFIAVAGNDINIRVSGFAPGSTVLVVLQPSGTVIGSLTVGTNGEVSDTLTIPSTSPIGASTLQVAGITPGPQISGAALGILVERAGSLALWEGNQVMVGFPSKSAGLSARGKKKMQTYVANMQERGSVQLVMVTAYPAPAKSPRAQERLAASRAESVMQTLQADGWAEVPMLTSVSGDAKKHPRRAGKVLVTVIYVR